MPTRSAMARVRKEIDTFTIPEGCRQRVYQPWPIFGAGPNVVSTEKDATTARTCPRPYRPVWVAFGRVPGDRQMATIGASFALSGAPGEGPLSEPTAAGQDWRQEPLFMPHCCRFPCDAGWTAVDPFPTFGPARSGQKGAPVRKPDCKYRKRRGSLDWPALFAHFAAHRHAPLPHLQ